MTFLQKKTLKEIHESIKQTLGGKCPSYTAEEAVFQFLAFLDFEALDRVRDLQ